VTTHISIGSRQIGEGQPVYVIAEIGINHNGDLEIAKKLMDVAASAGCDAVKFQKRTPELCVPEEQKSQIRETPWGTMTYLEYKERTEFGQQEYQQIDTYAKQLGIHWFASPWDLPSVDFLLTFDPVCIKVASASLTDDALLKKLVASGVPLILSTGMSTMDEIDHAATVVKSSQYALAHATSTYPCQPSELNLRMISTLKDKFQVPIGYSGHETGLATTLAAVAMGATFIERHITLDRAMWGTDHSASVEPTGLDRLVRDIRNIELAFGDGVKRVFESELPVRAKLRRN
jgi:N-acetylneuraminate synthase